MQFAEKPEEDRDPLPGPAQIPPKVAYLLGSDYAGIACLRPGQSRGRLGTGPRGVSAPSRGVFKAAKTRPPPPEGASGFRSCDAPWEASTALLQRFAVLGQVETFDLMLLAHP